MTDVRSEPWEAVVADAGPHDHVVQLYQDEDFLSRAVCRFVGSALDNGEGLILVPTLSHWNAFRPRLEAEGVNVDAVRRRGQLTVVDADEFLPRFLRGSMPDSPLFLGLAAEVIDDARAGGRYETVRWWGEMVNVLWERGDVAASMALEDLFDQVQHNHDIALFCSFLMDNFDGDVHARMLPRLGTNHSHLIPVEDYSRLESAVADALRETVGADEASALEDRLLSHFPQLAAPDDQARPRKPTQFNMPRAQALLLALRHVVPGIADPVLQRSRDLYWAARAS
ncbi:MAG: MEDS domain-containing protein [Ilumatobacteraceae bacterium]